MDGSGATLNLLGALIVQPLAADDETTPVAGPTLAGSLCRSHDDRLIGSAFHLAVTARLYDECGHCALVALDYCAGGDTEFCSFIHIHPTFQEIRPLWQSYIAGEMEVLRAVAELVAVEHDAFAVSDISLVCNFGIVGCDVRFVIV